MLVIIITFSKVVSNIGNKTQKGVVFDISGDSISLGVGTATPFSRLSFGENTNDGIINTEKPGHLSAFALHENSSGGNFKGLIYNSNLQSFNTKDTTTNGIQILNINGDFSVANTSNGVLTITEENVTIIGGNPTIGNEVDSGKINSVGREINDTDGQTKIVLDVKGSIRTNGYINFYNKVDATFVPSGSFWDTTNTERYNNIPHGSLWLSAPGGTTGNPGGLYYKNQAGNSILITGENSQSELTTSSAFFDGSLNSINSFIMQKSDINNQVGKTPVIFGGKSGVP